MYLKYYNDDTNELLDNTHVTQKLDTHIHTTKSLVEYSAVRIVSF